jgi:hypothetical protein
MGVAHVRADVRRRGLVHGRLSHDRRFPALDDDVVHATCPIGCASDRRDIVGC